MNIIMIKQLHSMLINVIIIGFDEGFNNHKTICIPNQQSYRYSLSVRMNTQILSTKCLQANLYIVSLSLLSLFKLF